MEDEADTLSNLCTDLVSLRRLEPGLNHLFRNTPPGTWTPIRDLYEQAGQPDGAIKAELAATWLPAPGSDPGYAVVVFFDNETKWFLTADYNLARLMNQFPQSPVAAAG